MKERCGKVFIGGRVVEPADARISIFDRGFLYGDSVFETLRVHAGVPFAFSEHLVRLMASGKRIGFDLPWSAEYIRDCCVETLMAAGLDDAYLRIIATRGAGTMGLDPSLAADPELLVLALELPEFPPGLYDQGRSAAFVSVRRNLKKAVDPEAKTGNYINSVMAVRDARGQGADEAIMLDVEGRVAEASSANVFVWAHGTWCTPPIDVGILGGITRSTILRLCEEVGIPCEARVIWPDELREADEMLLCSSVREIVPITKLDGVAVGSGQVGEHVKELMGLYAAEVQRQVAEAKA